MSSLSATGYKGVQLKTKGYAQGGRFRAYAYAQDGSQVQIGNFNGLRNLDNSNSLARVVHGLTKTPWVAPAPRS